MQYGSQEQTIDTMRSTAIKVDGELDDLQTYAEGKLHMWSGEDQQQYWICKANWNTLEKEMNDILVTMGAKSAEDIMQNVKDTERRNAGTWPA
jgi:uncharacterized protein YukE